jgi:hypothetical protein
MIPVNKDDYIIVRQGSKKYLCLAHNPERNKAVFDASFAEEEVRYADYDEDTLLANLGPKPPVGTSAFGVKIEPYVKTTELPIGTVYHFRRMKKAEGKAFRAAVKKTYKKMMDANLDVFPFTSTYIYPKRGKYSGMYSYSVRISEVSDKLTLFPETFEDQKWNEYMLFHEYGHAVWYKMLDNRVRAKWIKLYQKRMELTIGLKDNLANLLDDFLKSDEPIKSYKRMLEDHEQLVFGEAVAYIKRYYKLDENAIDILRIEDATRFAEMWPKRTVIIENIKEDPSKYAMTKPEELFAETFAFYMKGNTISSDLKKLMDNTLRRAIR